MGNPNIQIPITELLVKEVTMKGSFRYGVSLRFNLSTSVYTSCSPATIRSPLAWSGRGESTSSLSLHTGTLIAILTRRCLTLRSFPFTDAPQAFQVVKKGTGEDGVAVIKAIISGPYE